MRSERLKIEAILRDKINEFQLFISELTQQSYDTVLVLTHNDLNKINYDGEVGQFISFCHK